MKIASVVMTVLFAGVVAQANEPAHTATTTAPAAPATVTEAAPVKKAHAKKAAKADKKAENKDAAHTSH